VYVVVVAPELWAAPVGGRWIGRRDRRLDGTCLTMGGQELGYEHLVLLTFHLRHLIALQVSARCARTVRRLPAERPLWLASPRSALLAGVILDWQDGLVVLVPGDGCSPRPLLPRRRHCQSTARVC